ncbi:MAG: energy transducer TonB [Verrucomicrobiales bacterium]|nr:energy transducer TonB [Verrucomicrobiales bacterium]
MKLSILSESIAGVGELKAAQRRNRNVRLGSLFSLQGRFLRYLTSGLAVIMLLGFLSFSRWLDSQREIPDNSFRLLSGIDAVAMETPPPPPPADPPPPPPKTPPHPKLEIQLNSPAPPLQATTTPDGRPRMMMADFSTDQPQERKRMIFSLSDLDGQPKLLNRPPVTLPESLRRRGLTEGRVCLEVKIHPNGQVDVLRVVESSDSEFTSIATNFATRARFSPPKKDGRPVAAQFQWPIVLR